MAHSSSTLSLPRQFLRNCRKHPFRKKLADSAGAELTGGTTLLKSLVLARVLRREVLADDERHVGLLLPPSVGGVVTNAALALAGRVAVNLNYTLSPEALNHCVRTAGIRHVLTSRRVLERLPIKVDAPLVPLEDLLPKVTWRDKLAAALGAFALPIWLLERMLGLDRDEPSDLFTIIFTSGSTGLPKGVMLSHDNVRSNVAAIAEISRLKTSDVFLGVLPLFHAFGFTCTVWAVLTLDIGGAYHFNPLETHAVGNLCQKHRVTFVIGTPTLLRAYCKRIQPEQLAAVEIFLAGAEKMPSALFDAVEKKFGVRPVEGYGATELSPLALVNVPPERSVDPTRLTLKEGTVGLPLPGVEVKVVDLETEVPVPPDTPGMLLVRGPNVMLGYLGQPDLTARVIRDGWYTTGDVARIDRDGFVTLTGRISRFSKIGGEMVPHGAIEEELAKILEADDDEPLAVVAAVPDEAKGERLVVLHRALSRSPWDLCRELAARGLPKLWIPSVDSFLEVDAFPLLGTGKIDLQALKRMALAKFGPTG